MKPTITEEPVSVRLRDLPRPGTWSRLTIEQKLMVLQFGLSLVTLGLLIKLVAGS